MSSVWTYTPSGDDGWSIVMSDVGHDLSFALVTKEPADDNTATHCSIM
jgi:hypothetical protein